MYKVNFYISNIKQALGLLFLGACIYLFFRQDVIFISWIESGILNRIQIRILENWNNYFTYILLYCIPDALWYAALLILQMPFYNLGILNKIFVYVCIILPFIMEALQYIRLLPGTFDWLDILTYCLTFIIITLCKRKHSYKLE